MPQSQASVLLHVIFSTRNRAPFLTDKKFRDELNASMVGTLQARLCPSLIVRCVDDHLHALVRLSRTMTIAQLVETMKVESSALVSGRTSSAVGSSWYRIR
jgi:REP element-mobilizing transposase RayT